MYPPTHTHILCRGMVSNSFAKNKNDQETEIQNVFIFRLDVGMVYGIEKYTALNNAILNKGKKVLSKWIKLIDQKSIKTLQNIRSRYDQKKKIKANEKKRISKKQINNWNKTQWEKLHQRNKYWDNLGGKIFRTLPYLDKLRNTECRTNNSMTMHKDNKNGQKMEEKDSAAKKIVWTWQFRESKTVQKLQIVDNYWASNSNKKNCSLTKRKTGIIKWSK